jgi:hypothetical protein
MVQDRPWIAALAAVAAGALGVAAVWFAMPSTFPEVDGTEASEAAEVPRRPVASLPGLSGPMALDDRGKGRVRSKAKAGKAKAPRENPDPPEDRLEPDDRAALRDELREERIVSLADRLDGYAAEAGWDPELTDRVAEVMLGTTDKIGRNLARVDRGEVEWNEVRGELRDYRIDQARKVRNLLGDEEFDRFVDGMDLARFMGERPIRGRLE